MTNTGVIVVIEADFNWAFPKGQSLTTDPNLQIEIMIYLVHAQNGSNRKCVRLELKRSAKSLI